MGGGGGGAENTFFSVTSAGLVSWNAENCIRDISKSVYTCTSMKSRSDKGEGQG